MPRLDYSGSCPALLLEPQRTNLLNHGEYFGAWTLNAGGTGSTPLLEANTTDTLSPEGKYNAYKVTLDAGAGTTTSDESIMYRSKSGLTAGSDHTASVYLKGAVGGEEVIVRDTSGSYKKWTLTTEWARYDYTQIAAAASYATSFGIRQGVAGTINSDAVVYIYGFQSELGSYPTSYIPTMGASVTRSVDVADGITINTNANHTMLYDLSATTGRQTSSGLINIGYDSSNRYFIKGTSTSNVQLQVGCIGVFSGNINPTNEVSGRNKIAVQWIDGTGYVYCNGVKQSGTLSNSSSANDIDYYGFSGVGYSHKTHQFVIFPTALTDSECIALTTI